MKYSLFKRTISLLLALVCIVGLLPAPASAAGGVSSAPASITQQYCSAMTIGGQLVYYESAASEINNEHLPHVFIEEVDVPGYGTTRALCAYYLGRLSSNANGQRWNFKQEIPSASLKTILTYIYSCTYGDFTEAGNARGLEHWGEYWSAIWMLVAQGLSWYYEYGILKDVNADREAFIEQAAEEFLAVMKLYHQTYGQSSWLTNWDDLDTHSIIDSRDGGITGYSAYDYIATGVNLVLDHPEYFHNYHMWLYEWDDSQPWLVDGEGTMQTLLVPVPDVEHDEDEPLSLTVKKLEAGTNQPIPGVTFTVESADGSGDYSVTRQTGPDGTFTLTSEADDLGAGQYRITETAAPEGYQAQTESQLVTVMPGIAASSAVTFYNEKEDEISGDGTIRKVDADNPTVGIPGAVIRITSVKLDDGGSFTGSYITGEGGYVSKEDLDFASLPFGSYVAEEITPPEGYILSSDVSKVKQTFVWDGKADVSLVFENSSKVKVQLQKVDESGKPLAGAIFIVLRDGQIIATEETGADGTITVPNVSEGYYEFVEVSAPAGYDCDRTPVGAYVNAWDLQGEQTIVVTKTNYHKRSLTVEKIDAETGDPVPNTSFHIRGINVAYENDVTTGTNGTVTLPDMISGCYEIEEMNVPSPYILDTNNRKTVWIDAGLGKDITVTFANSKKPGLIIRKIDAQTGEPLSNVLFKVEEVNGGYSDQHFTDANGMIVLDGLTPGTYTVTEVKPKDGYVGDDTVHVVQLEANKTTTIELRNLRKPDLTIKKVDSVTGEPIKGAKFQIWRGSDDTKSGEYNDLGIYYSEVNGEIHLEQIDTGWYKIQELEAPAGYIIKQPDTQEIYLAAGQNRTLIFENVPKSIIIVEKYDSVTHEALPGCTFQLRQFFGVSGTGGTVISKKVTDENGVIKWTGLTPGTYIVEEVDAADGYNITNSSETVYLADDGEQATVTLMFSNDPDGSLLIRKVCAVNPSVALQDAEFKVLYTDGSVVGDSNGIFRTDENGEVLITGLTPGKSVVVTETRAPDGFILDTQSQTIQIKAGRIMTLTFKNQPKGELIIQKRDSQTGEVLPGAEFRITTAAGCEVGLDGVIGTSTLTQNGIFTTDAQGEIHISNLAPGAYVITEIKAPDGYVIDTPSTNVVIGANGDTQTVVIKNTKKGNLIVEKYDSVTKQPLPGARFKITTANGELVADNEGMTSSNGLYTTDVNGQIILSKLLPGTYIVTEDKAPDNYQKDPTPQTVVVNAGDTQTLRFYDDPLCALSILKRDAVTGKPLQGAEFTVKDSEGRVIGTYTTGSDGTATVTGLTPNATIVVSESKAPSGYVLDQTPQHIVVRPGAVNSLTFEDQPTATLIIHKYIEGTNNEPLAGVVFKVVDGSGAPVGTGDGTFYTNDAGEIVIEGLEPGTTVTAYEIKTVDGFVLDGTPKGAQLQAGRVSELTFWNKQAGTLVIQKKDSVSGEMIPGAQFQLTYANGGFVDNDNGHLSSNGIYTTDDKGEIRISGVIGTIVVKEIQAAPGYVIDADTQTQTVTVNPMDTQTLVFLNEPLCSLTIKKLDSVTGKPVSGAVFEVKKGSTNILGNYTTGQYGTVTVTGLIPESTYIVTEVKVPDGYVLDSTPKAITVKNGANTLSSGVTSSDSTGTGDGNGLTFENDPKMTLTIRKYIEGTNYEPLAGVCFMVTDSRGAAIGPGNGEFYTNAAGMIVIEDLEPGTTVIAREIKTVDGFVLDGTPKSVVIEAGKNAPELIFWNKRAGTLVIEKRDSVTGALIPGAQFQLTYANGGYVDQDNGHLSSNGLYTTDAQGQIRISGIIGTVVVKEVQAASGYMIDPATQTQTVTVNPMDTQTLTFLNDPLCSLTITKLDSVTGKPVPGTVFEVKDGNGNVIGRYTTGSDGSVTVTGLIPGTTYVVTEVKVPDGYVLNPAPQVITVTNGKNTLGGSSGNGANPGSTGNGSGNGLTFENDPKMTLTIHKYIEGTQNEPLAGVAFKVTYGSGAAVGPGDGVFYTNAAGEIVIEGLEPGTTVTVREIKTVDGFVLDGTPKSVKIEAGRNTAELTFWNARAGELVIRKLDSVTKQPLAGVEFELTYAGGGYVDTANGHLSSNGLYTTDAHGEIHVTGVTGTIVVKETRTIDGYTIDEATRIQTVTVNPMDTQTLTFYNAPKQTLTIQKYVDGTTIPIQGVAFLVTDSGGAYVGPNNGEYVTDKNGRIIITDLTPGVTITAKEIRTVSGYVLDPTPQSILIKSGAAQTLTFYNKAEGGLELIKVSESDATKRIPGTTFEIRRMDGGLVTTVTTDSTGRVHVNLDAGDYYAVETVAARGFMLDSTPHYFTVQDGKTTTMTVKNKPLAGILIHKTDSVTGKGLYGVTFLLYDSTYTPIGQYVSDNQGYIYIEGLTAGGRYYLRELENEGYIVDTQMKTVYVQAGETTLIEWQNTPITGQIQITKKSADYNPTNGLPAGTLLEGAVFEIYDKAGNLVDTIRSDSRGVASSKPLPLGRYTIREVKAPANYGISGQDLTAYLEHAGEIVRFEVTNKSLTTGVSITKIGPKQVMAGQPVNYTFSDIANTSNVMLTSFYWRDIIPAEVRLNIVVTGTYNFPGTYKITYRVNGGEYRTLADNLSTSKNYTLAASPAALGLASNERVTEIMFVFGQAPAGFAQVEKPMLKCTAVSNIAFPAFTNIADVGGVYNGQWVQAITRWVTTVYKPTVPNLPYTGY